MKFLNKVIKFLKNEYYEVWSYKLEKEVLFNKIINDKKTIKEFKKLNPDFLIINPPKKDLLFQTYLRLRDQYKKNYCLMASFKHLNHSERLQYLTLRVEIDKLLNIKNTKYQI